MRITTSMIQRNVLADLNHLSSSLAKTQGKASSGNEISRPSDDPFKAAQAMGLRSAMGQNEQFIRNISDAQTWQDSTESALDSVTTYVNRAHELLVGGASDTSDPTARKAIASEIDQIIQGLKESANAKVGDNFLMSGTKTATAPYAMGADDTYKGNGDSVVREIGPGVSMSINTFADETLGSGGADGKLLSKLRDISQHLKDNDSAALRGGDIAGLDTELTKLLEVRARNGAQSNRLEFASTRLDQIQETVLKQLSDTEDADIAKTMIDFNSQSAAYQASLRAGASIVQASLMDFLR